MLFFSALCRCGPVKAPPGTKKHRDIPCPDAPRFDFVVSAQTAHLYKRRKTPRPFRFRNGSQTVDSAYFQVITARIPQITAIPIQTALAILLRSKNPLPAPVMAQEIAKRVMRAKRILITFRMTHFFIWFNSFADSHLLNQVYHTLLRISKGRIPPPRWCPAFARLPFWAVLSQNFLPIRDFTSQTLASFRSALVGACLPQTLLETSATNWKLPLFRHTNCWQQSSYIVWFYKMISY